MTHNDEWKGGLWGAASPSCLNYNSSTNPLMWVTVSIRFGVPYVDMDIKFPCPHNHRGIVIVFERLRDTKWNQSRPKVKREGERLTMCVRRGKMGKEAKRERECKKPLAPCLQSAICWWRGSWRGGAQRPFLAMRSSLINKTKRVSCVTPICYLHPCSRTPFISI